MICWKKRRASSSGRRPFSTMWSNSSPPANNKGGRGRGERGRGEDSITPCVQSSWCYWESVPGPSIHKPETQHDSTLVGPACHQVKHLATRFNSGCVTGQECNSTSPPPQVCCCNLMHWGSTGGALPAHRASAHPTATYLSAHHLLHYHPTTLPSVNPTEYIAAFPIQLPRPPIILPPHPTPPKIASKTAPQLIPPAVHL